MKTTNNNKMSFGNTMAILLCAASLTFSAENALVDSASRALTTLDESNRGVSIGGTMWSGFNQSQVNGAHLSDVRPANENLAYTRADVEIIGRPSAETAGRLEFRLHQDWANSFREGPNLFVTRWFSFDGRAFEGSLNFNVGDYYLQTSPLTVASTDAEMLMEPELYAVQRKLAQDDRIMQAGKRLLQGLNLDGDLALGDVASMNYELNGARLRRPDKVYSGLFNYNTDSREKWYGGAGLGFSILDAVELKGHFVRVQDRVKSSRSHGNAYAIAERWVGAPALYTKDYEYNDVTSGELGIDVASLLGNKNLLLSLDGEFAMSTYELKMDQSDSVGTEVRGADTIPLHVLNLHWQKSLADQALHGSLTAGWKSSAFSLKLKGTWMDVGADFVSDMAQSPSFVPRTVMNSANLGIGGLGSTFDALYGSVYEMQTVNVSNKTEGEAEYNGTNNWYRTSFEKNSWNSTILTRVERAAAKYDIALQSVLPYGLATPDRVGLSTGLELTALDGVLELEGRFVSLSEHSDIGLDSAFVVDVDSVDENGVVLPIQDLGNGIWDVPQMAENRSITYKQKKAELTEVGAGLRLHIGALFGLERAMSISGSYVVSNVKREVELAATAAGANSDELAEQARQDLALQNDQNLENRILNTGASLAILDWMTLLAGYQWIHSNDLTLALDQQNMGGGVRFALSVGTELQLDYTYRTLEDSKNDMRFNQGIMAAGLKMKF